jgi:hypothetical protein
MRRVRVPSLLLAAVVACVLSSTHAVAAVYQTVSAATSSQLNSFYDFHKLFDGDKDTYWVSSQCFTVPCNTEWLAFWIGGPYPVDYLRLVAPLYTQAEAVPHSINIYYSSGGSWHPLMMGLVLDGPFDYPRSGQVIYLPQRVTTDGFKIESSDLGTDEYGGRYFEMAEVYAGDSTVSSKSIVFGSSGSQFQCDAYADSPHRVLTNDGDNFAFDLSVTQLSSAPPKYVAVFHSEGFGEGPGAIGDSVAVRYASGTGASGDSFFGTRTGSNPGDYVVTRTGTPSTYMYAKGTNQFSPPFTQPLGYPASNGANPMFIKRRFAPGPEWTLFFLTVADAGDGRGWRDYLMAGHPWDVNNMTNTSWVTLKNDAGGAPSGDAWLSFCASNAQCGSLGLQSGTYRPNYNPFPMRRNDAQNLPVASRLAGSIDTTGNPPAWGPTYLADTQGLIGNISFGDPADPEEATTCATDPTKCKMHHFYFDYKTTYGHPETYGNTETYRSDSVDGSTINLWSPETRVMNGWAHKIAYHPARHRWAVLSNCATALGNDVCLQFSRGPNMSTLSSLSAHPTDLGTTGIAKYSLGLSTWFRDRLRGGVMEQFGILKNADGQILGDDFRVYVGERNGKPGNSDPNQYAWVWGMDVNSIRVSCHDCAGGNCP